MKLAILNRDPNTHPGGDVLSARELMGALRKLGVEADVFETPGWTANQLAPYDWVYIKHVNFGWSWFNLQMTWEANKPYILQPMFYPTFKLGMNQTQIKEALIRSSLLHLNSDAEYDALERLGVMPDNRVPLITPNGTSEIFHSDSPKESRPMACLTVSARGESDKNVQKVQEDCRRIGLSWATITGREYEEMPDLYAASVVFINASDSERCSRTIAEALCSGCRVLATKHNWSNHWYGPGLVTFDPDEDFSELIREAYHAKEWDYSPNQAARSWTWDRVARMLLEVIDVEPKDAG